MTQLFFSYTHVDEELRDRIELSLIMLRRQGLIDNFHDRQITAGEQFDNRISAELEAAEIILLLVSSDFLASEYCYSVEVDRALERHKSGEACVIPIILRTCDWKQSPLKDLLALPEDGKPVTKWADTDEVMQNITEGVRASINQINSIPEKKIKTEKMKPSNKSLYVDSPAPRSANLHIKRDFTDRDRDLFQRDTYEYITQYFQNSLAELERRAPDIQTKFREIDADKFVAAGYHHGSKVTACTIFVGSTWGSHSISYNDADDGNTSTTNASLEVQNDDQGMFLSMPFGGWAHDNEKKLTQEGSAEAYWEMFMGPLQRGQ